MFGPTFARLDNLSRENAIVITEAITWGGSFSWISIGVWD